MCCPLQASYYCPAGSTTSTPFLCPIGQYCATGQRICRSYRDVAESSSPTLGVFWCAGSAAGTPCPVGSFGSTAGLASSTCSGLCEAGFYGATSGAVSSQCDGPAQAGFYTFAGATSATQFQVGDCGVRRRLGPPPPSRTARCGCFGACCVPCAALTAPCNLPCNLPCSALPLPAQCPPFTTSPPASSLKAQCVWYSHARARSHIKTFSPACLPNAATRAITG